MKFRIYYWITEAIPGVLIDTKVRIVKKDRSLRRPQRYWMTIARNKFKTIVPGSIAICNISMLLLMEAAKFYIPELT